MGNKLADINKFYIAGINYKKTDAGIRGQFAISGEKYERILDKARSIGLQELFILSTCNRTEVYGFAEHPSQLVDLLCLETVGSSDLFLNLSYIKKGKAAISHLFQVAAGLDSQILGDYEIVGQIKQAVKFSKERGYILAFTERLFNCILQSSKAIKNQTTLSSGTVSVSFAAVQYIKESLKDYENKKILLVGTGKIGRNTCKNLVDYLGNKNITLCNRSEEKSFSLADELGLRSMPIENLKEEMENADIVIVATGATQPIITRKDLIGSGTKLMIDLSIPHNIETLTRDLEGITLVNVDDLSRTNDATLQKREAEIPRAKEIIAEHMEEFLDWHEMRKHVPILTVVKNRLKEIPNCPLFTSSTQISGTLDSCEENIQRIINGMAIKMRSQNARGCQYIEAINEFITTGIN
jgi:glutamyl-tRNA reductase